MRDFTKLKIILLSLFAILVLLPTYSLAQSTGSIGGSVVDAKDNSPLIGATVKLVGYNIGAITDDNGNFIILNVDVGTYDIEASYIGYTPKQYTGIRVSVDQRTKISFSLESGEIITKVIVIEAERKGIDVEQSGRIIDDQQIKNSGTRGVTNIVSKTAGVVTDERGQNINIRGGRSDESVVIVDGVETTNPLDGSSRAFVPNSLMQEISVLTGGFGAEYGNVLSGVINVSTKSGTDRFSGSVELITDEFTGRWFDSPSQGYNLYNVTFGGPLIPTKKLARVINLFGSVERTFQRISLNSWVVSRLPVTVPDGKLKDNESGSWSYNGRLNFNFKEIPKSKVPIVLKLGASLNNSRYRTFSGINILSNSFRNPINTTEDYLYFARISHDVTRNFFYEIQGSYNRTLTERSDPYFGDNLGWYGDTNHVPGLNAYFQNIGITNAQGRIITGYDPKTASLYRLPNTIIDFYNKQDVSYLGVKLDATWAILSKKVGDHEIKLGGEYKYHTLKRISVYPVIISDLTIGNPLDKWYSTNNGRLKSFGYEIRDPYTNDLIANGEDAKHPITGGFYIRDKVSFADFNFNGGVRVDFLDANTYAFKDFRTDLYGLDGQVATEDDFVDTKINWSVSPRLGFSFPVTDKTIFHTQYGKMIKLPQLNLLYVSKETIRRFFQTSLQDVIENSALKPEKLTSYEIGIKHQVGDIADLGLTVFYKESTDLLGVSRIVAGEGVRIPFGYVIYDNTDFAISRGLDFYFHLRRMYRLSVDFSYTLAYATGTGSDPYSKTSLANNPQEELPQYVYSLDYDQRHTGVINLDYRFGDNDVPSGIAGHILRNLGINFDFFFHSGRPYTRREVAQSSTSFSGDRIFSSKNELYTDWSFRLDMKIDKTIRLLKTNWNFYVYIINVLDTKIVDDIFEGTGLPNDNGYLQTPTGASTWATNSAFRLYWPERINSLSNWPRGSNYGPPRQIRFGLNVSF